MLISTGVEPSALPFALRSKIVGDSKDTYGWGTWAASILLSMIPDVEITSRNAGPGLINLSANLAEVAADPGRFDIVLLAFNPSLMLEPSAAMAQAGVGAIGTNPATGEVVTGSRWDQLQEAILKNPGIATNGGRVVGIPASDALRDRVFARSKGKERAAVEYALARQAAWDAIKAQIHTIFSEGVPVVMPAGDWQQSAVAKPVVGLATLPEVIAVGATSQGTDGAGRSAISATGTLGLRAKPDMWANSNVVGVVPGSADSGAFFSTYGSVFKKMHDTPAAGTEALEYASTVEFAGLPGCSTTTCLPSTGLAPTQQGSTIVAAAVATAQLGHLIAQGWPAPASARVAGVLTSNDAKVIRGLAWATPMWGSIPSLPPLPSQVGPLLLDRPWFGSVPWNSTRSVTVPISALGLVPESATLASSSVQAGVSASFSFPPGSMTMTMTLTTQTPVGGKKTFGINFDTGGTVDAEALLSVPVKIRATHPFAPDATKTPPEGMQSETFALLPGLPEYIGPFSEATALLPPDLTDLPIRIGVTDGDGVATIQDVVPGFYRLYLIDDHGAVADQEAGGFEGLAPVLSGGGISGVFIPATASCSDFPGGACVNSGGPDPAIFASTGVGLCDTQYGASGYTKTYYTYCGKAFVLGPTGVFTRGVHLPVWKDFTTCSATVPVGLTTPLSSACGGAGSSSTNAWSWSAHAADCASNDPLPDSSNINSDSATATYSGSVPLASPTSVTSAPSTLPITKLKYTFPIPQPASDLDATVDFAYHISNTIALLTLTAGDSDSGDVPSPDGVSAVIITRDPHVVVDPGITVKGATGSVGWRTTLLTAGATQATLTITLIPTTWVSAAPLGSARFEMCNLGIRAKTFARQIWKLNGAETSPRVRSIPIKVGTTFSDPVTSTDPNRCRGRKAWIADPGAGDYHTFRLLGTECEQAWAGIEVPKNDGYREADGDVVAGTDPVFHVTERDSNNNPTAASYLSDVVGNSSLVTAMQGRGTKLYDPERGVHPYNCEEQTQPDPSDLANSANPNGILDATGSIDALCLAKDTDGYEVLFPEELTTNGRYFSTLGIDDTTLRGIGRTANGRTVTATINEAPSPSCPGQCPVFPCAVDPLTGLQYPNPDATMPNPSPHYVPGPTVGTFFGPERHPELNSVSFDVSAAVLSVGTDASAGSLLWFTITAPMLGQHTISTDLNCITLDNGSKQCRPA